ncbi:MAG: metallophosphoesterase family protein [Promethearchaeota archaeon]|jgi:DNA repair exonuclease SbcCD nuclease subunit
MTIDNCFEAKFGSQPDRDNSESLVKFIHASDIHLGAAQYRNESRSWDFIQAFQEILELAISNQTDFIILGGDVFTSLEMLPGNLTKVITILNEFKNYTEGTIPIITIEGNHDIRKYSRGVRFSKRGQSWLKLIATLNLVILLDADFNAPLKEIYKPYDFEKKKGGKIKIKNISIYGNRFLDQNPEKLLPKIHEAIVKEDATFNILLQHFGIEGQMENVPGVALTTAKKFKDRVDYLALGHFHKQFIIDNWIFNPGSSEATCSIDSSFKRGVFLIEVKYNEKFTKNVKMIRLNNRCHQWEIINLSKYLKNKDEFHNFIVQKLEPIFKYSSTPSIPLRTKMPLLNLILKGKIPLKSKKINTRELTNLICEKFPVVDVRVYQKFTNSLTTLDKYI